jgi:UrcA family protein
MTTLIQVPADEPRARSAGSRVKYALLLSAALGCALAARSSNAAAADGNAAAADGAVRTLVVKFSADTLDTDQGVHVLYHKLVRAADKVCPQTESSPWVSDAVRACRKQALARAVGQINNPHLAALHATASTSG